MRRLAIALLGTAAVLALAAPAHAAEEGGDTAATAGAPVDVLQVSGLFDEIIVNAVSDAITRAEDEGSQALVLQVNSKGAVVSDAEMTELLQQVADAEVPIAIWVGPTGARLYGTPAQLLAVADVTGMAPGARVGYTGEPLVVNGEEVGFGAATDVLHNDSLGLSDARRLNVFKQRISDEGIATMEGGGSYNQTDAEGFLRIQGLPVRVQGRVTPREY